MGPNECRLATGWHEALAAESSSDLPVKKSALFTALAPVYFLLVALLDFLEALCY